MSKDRRTCRKLKSCSVSCRSLKCQPNMEKHITALEKLQAKVEQYNKRNNVEISGISNELSDNDLAEEVIGICKDFNFVITSSDIEGFHRWQLERNSTSEKKRVIVKFLNSKHSELMLRLKKNINSKSKVYVNTSLCPYYCFLWEKYKKLQGKGKVNLVFSLGLAVTVRITENASL